MSGNDKPGLGYKARRLWSLVLLLVGLPIYIVSVVTILNWQDRLPIWLELLVFVALGVVWVLPFKFVFRGVGKEDPDKDQN